MMRGERIEVAGLDDADEPTHALLPARTQGRHHPFIVLARRQMVVASQLPFRYARFAISFSGLT